MDSRICHEIRFTGKANLVMVGESSDLLLLSQQRGGITMWSILRLTIFKIVLRFEFEKQETPFSQQKGVQLALTIRLGI